MFFTKPQSLLLFAFLFIHLIICNYILLNELNSFLIQFMKEKDKKKTSNQQVFLFLDTQSPLLELVQPIIGSVQHPHLAAYCHHVPPPHLSDANCPIKPLHKSHRCPGHSTSDCHTSLHIDPLHCFISTLLSRLSASFTRSAFGRPSNLLLVLHGPHPLPQLSSSLPAHFSQPGGLHLQLWRSCRSIRCPDPLKINWSLAVRSLRFLQLSGQVPFLFFFFFFFFLSQLRLKPLVASCRRVGRFSRQLPFVFEMGRTLASVCDCCRRCRRLPGC